MEKKVMAFVYNYFTSEYGEECTIKQFDSEIMDSIIYHEAQGEGDKHHITIYYKSGKATRYFNINEITFLRESIYESKMIKGEL